MGPKTTFSALHDFCAERLGAPSAARLVRLARPGFELTQAGPGEAAGHSRFGGRAMLEPGTPWPDCEGTPLSLLAVLDTDALAPWLDDLLPAGTGLLNFFALDSASERADPAAFEPVPWSAAPGFAFPDAWDPAWGTVDLGSVVDDMPLYDITALLPGWPEQPYALHADDLAFGWPLFPTGSSPMLPDGEESSHYQHLLQLSGQDEWWIGGDSGWMHWSIPTGALRGGDFSRTVPTPDIW
ncbi:hypothetical protein VT50_0201780 [Streptomyces antioxidans]|uniref:DUF1963 domain-containing protein n=2 Tax=Streptomyces antioxidans TaxID=1507734 RepID=A0A1V4DDH0_9ACTN|nr:hypothetical protein VT50_0201780 [Streptomyces antioxidans]